MGLVLVSIKLKGKGVGDLYFTGPYGPSKYKVFFFLDRYLDVKL